MKAIAFLSAVAIATLAFGVSTASSQKACMKDFQACMDGCAAKTAKSGQDGCFQGCQGKNNLCAEHVYGKRPSAAPPAAEAKDTPKDVPEQGAKDALATTDKTEKQAADARDQADAKPVKNRRPQRASAGR